MLTLCGIAIVVAGFVAGINLLLVVTVAAVVSALGRVFTQNRYVGMASPR